MPRALVLSLLLISIRAYADCKSAVGPSQYTVDVHSPVCNAGSPCLQNTPIHFSAAARAGDSCFIPFYPGPCPPPYAIDSCDTLSWDFGDGTPAVIVHGSGEVDHIFPKTGNFTVQVTISSGAGTGTIRGAAYVCANPPSFVRFGQPVYTVAENGGSVTITLERSGDLSRAIDLDYTTFPNDPPAEFVHNLEPLAMKISFAPGEATKTITHRVQDDNVFTGDSDHSIGVLSDGAAVMDAGPVTTAVIRVADDEPGPALTIDDVTVPEGNGEHTIDFPLHLSAPAAAPVLVWCVPHDGTAHAGTDFYLSGSAATFEPGQTSATCQVTILANTIPEPAKTFTVSTDPVQGPVTVKKGTALGTLTNDDGAQSPRHRAAR
jgi:PKD repeat protein